MRTILTKKWATLGFAGVLVAVLTVTQAPPTLAQTESYITAADEASACEGVCNTYVPPQDEQECRDLANERWQTEYFRSTSALGRLQTRRKAELQESEDIFVDEEDASSAVLKERVHIATAVCTTRIAGAAAALTACLASPAGATIAGAILCSSTYTAAVAGFLATMKREVDAAWKAKRDANELARHRKNDRDAAIKALYDKRAIKALYDKREANETAQSDLTLALIEEDLRICLERVNN